MKYVIDASVALKWVLDEPGKAAADALLDDELLAPSLWLLEAANALWKRTQRGDIGADEGKTLLAELYNAPVTTVPAEADLPSATEIANRLRRPVHDCLYLALAVREQAQLVTADRRFLAAVQGDPALGGLIRLL